MYAYLILIKETIFRIANKCTVLSNKKRGAEWKGTETNRSLTVTIHVSRYPVSFQAPLANPPHPRYISDAGLLEPNWYSDISLKPRVTQRYPCSQLLPSTPPQSRAEIEQNLFSFRVVEEHVTLGFLGLQNIQGPSNNPERLVKISTSDSAT